MNIKLYENKPGHYKHIYFNIKLYGNKSSDPFSLITVIKSYPKSH